MLICVGGDDDIPSLDILCRKGSLSRCPQLFGEKTTKFE